MEVVYEDSGLAAILGQLIEQKVKAGRKVARTRGSITVKITDMNAEATVYFEGDRIIVKNGGGGNACIEADFATINALTAGKVGTLGVVKLMLKGKLKIKGIGMARRLQALLS